MCVKIDYSNEIFCLEKKFRQDTYFSEVAKQNIMPTYLIYVGSSEAAPDSLLSFCHIVFLVPNNIVMKGLLLSVQPCLLPYGGSQITLHSDVSGWARTVWLAPSIEHLLPGLVQLTEQYGCDAAFSQIYLSCQLLFSTVTERLL